MLEFNQGDATRLLELMQKLVDTVIDIDRRVAIIEANTPKMIPSPSQSNDPLTLSEFKAMVTRGNYLILDTETTALDGVIVQIAIIDDQGQVLLDTLVKPVDPIPHDATRIHGITDDMVKNAPTWREIEPVVLNMVKNRDLIVYNAKFDRGAMHRSAESLNMPKTEWKTIVNFHCAMEAYAEFWGERRYGKYTWQSLGKALEQQRIARPNLHSALGDCIATLRLIRKMAGV